MQRLAPRLVWLKVALGLAALALLIPLGPSSEPASGASGDFPSGTQNTVVVVENSGSATTTVEAVYLRTDGSEVVGAAEVSTLDPGQSTSFRQAANVNLPPGFRGSAAIFSDRSIASLNLKNINDGGTLAIGASNGSPVGYELLAFPIVYKGAASGWNTRLTIQNASDHTACLRLRYVDRGGERIESFAEPSVACPGGGTVLPAFSTHVLDASDMPVDDGFIGAVSADTLPNAQGKVALLAGDTDFWGPARRFASYRAAGQATRSALGGSDDVGLGVYLPEVMREAGGAGDWYTMMQIYNTSTEAPANVKIRYRGPGLPAGEVTETLQVDGVVDIYHNSDPLLPSGFHGSAVITSDRPIAVSVGRGKIGSQIYGAYLAAAAQSSGTTWYLPLLYRRYAPGGSDLGWNSWFRVQVKDGGAAQVTVKMVSQPDDPYGCPFGTATATVTVSGNQTFYQWRGDGWADRDLPNCFSGGATITADKAIVVLGNITAAKAYTADVEATYNGAR